MSHKLRKTGMAVLLGASLLMGVSVTTQAQAPDRHYRCEQRVRRAEENLRRAIARHGEHSRQAERRRRELEEVRARCSGL
jgi:hypothetical protein